MDKIQVEFTIDEWVWWIEFLTQLYKQSLTDEYEQEDTARIINALKDAKQGMAIQR